MITRTYINRRDNNKYLLIRKYDDGHTVAKQFIEWSNGVRNYTGASLRGRGRFGRFSRVTKHFFREVVNCDYELLNEGRRDGVSLWVLVGEWLEAERLGLGTGGM